jgi:hypothetical protein
LFAEDSALFVSDDAYSIIWTIDIDNEQAIGGFSVPGDAIGNVVPSGKSGLAFDGADLFYTHSSSRTVWALDPVSGGVRRTLVKPSIDIAGLGAGGGALYALTSASQPGTLYKMDPFTGAVLESTTHPGARSALDFSAVRNTLFMKVGELELREIRATTKEKLASFPPPSSMTGLAVDDSDGSLFGVSEDSILYHMNRITGAVLNSFELQDTAGNPLVHCGGLAIAPGGLPGNGAGLLAGGGAGTLPQLELKAQETTITAGETGEALILLSSTEESEGFQIALVHEPGILSLQDISIEGTQTSAHNADFSSIEILPNGGALAVILDLLRPFLYNVLPPGNNQVIAKYTYEVVDRSLENPVQTQLRFLDNVLGVPLKRNLVIYDGVELSAEVFPGRITCLPRPESEVGPHLLCGGPLDEFNVPSPLEVYSGDSVEAFFYYTFPDSEGFAIQGMSMSIAYDCRINCLENSFSTPSDSITSIRGADFVSFQSDCNPDDGDGCEMIIAILVDARPPFGCEPWHPAACALPETQIPLQLGSVTLELDKSLQVGECFEIAFVDGLNGNGLVPIKNLVSVENFSVTPSTTPCQVCITARDPHPSVYCGSDTLGDNGRPEPLVGRVGETVEVCFWYKSAVEDVYAVTQSLRFDCRLQCLEETFRLTPDIPSLDQADFISFTCNNDPAGPGPCEMALSIVGFSYQSQTGIPLPPAIEPAKLGGVQVRITDDTLGLCLAIEYHDTDTTSTSVELNSGVVTPDTFDCKVCVGPLPKFFCGGPIGPDGLPTRIEDINRGDQTEICFWYCSPATEMEALSMAVCFDCSITCIEESFRIPPNGVLDTLQPDFISFHCDNNPLDGDRCEMVFGVLMDLIPPIDRYLPATDPILKLFCIDMEVGPLAKPYSCLPITFCDSINGRGRVPIKNIASVRGQPLRPETFDCAICTPFLGPKFFCGGPELDLDGKPVNPVGSPGDIIKLFLWYCSPEDFSYGHVQLDQLQGLSMALTFDCRLSCIEESLTLPPDSITAALNAEYVSFQCDNDPADGDGCEMILAILMDAEPPFDGQSLPPTEVPLKIACVDMIGPEIPDCAVRCFPIRFKDGIGGRGNIPTSNLVSAENWSFLAITHDCEICMDTIPDPLFIRGDCNYDGEFDIADPAKIISILFGLEPWQPTPPCLDACDNNDDGRIDVVDAAILLQYFFLQGPPPAPPGPFELGPDPTEDKLGCDLEPCPEE